MPITPSPLQLEGYYIQELYFVVRQPPDGPTPLFFQLGLHPQLGKLFDPGDMTINAQIGGAVHKEEPNRLVSIVTIETRTPPEVKFPYDFRVVLAGYFRIDAKVSEKDRANAIEALRTTAASVLYSAARELIASITGRGPYPAAILPTVVISLDPMEVQEQAEQEQPQGKLTAAKKNSRKGAAKKAAGKKVKKKGKKS